jgi:DNA-binding transcriptional regulator YhcF (GntR family)
VSGYALIHRTLLGHPAFRNDSEAMAFAWLIVKASWRPTSVRYKGHRIQLERGQVAVSVRDMAAALDRDKAWVERLWRRLKRETMIETAGETGVSVVTICNYDDYQAASVAGETPRKAAGEAANETVARQSRDTEQRKEESKKEYMGRKSALPDGWKPQPFSEGSKCRSIVDRWSPDQLALQVERFTAHHQTRGNRFTDWQAAWKTWVLNSSDFAAARRPAAGADESNLVDLVLARHAHAQKMSGK